MSHGPVSTRRDKGQSRNHSLSTDVLLGRRHRRRSRVRPRPNRTPPEPPKRTSSPGSKTSWSPLEGRRGMSPTSPTLSVVRGGGTFGVLRHPAPPEVAGEGGSQHGRRHDLTGPRLHHCDDGRNGVKAVVSHEYLSAERPRRRRLGLRRRGTPVPGDPVDQSETRVKISSPPRPLPKCYRVRVGGLGSGGITTTNTPPRSSSRTRGEGTVQGQLWEDPVARKTGQDSSGVGIRVVKTDRVAVVDRCPGGSRGPRTVLTSTGSHSRSDGNGGPSYLSSPTPRASTGAYSPSIHLTRIHEHRPGRTQTENYWSLTRTVHNILH